MKSTDRNCGYYISQSRANQKTEASSIYNSNYSTAYVSSVSFSREEMNDAYAKARSRERVVSGANK